MDVIALALCVALALALAGVLSYLASPGLPQGPLLWVFAFGALVLATWLLHDEP